MVVKKRKTDRDQFIGTHVTKEVKLEIIKEAERRDVSMSLIVAEILTEAFKKDEVLQASG